MEEDLKSFIEIRFGVTIEVFLQALRSSPSANGYITGAISELLLKNYLENVGYEVLRIKEKPAVIFSFMDSLPTSLEHLYQN